MLMQASLLSLSGSHTQENRRRVVGKKSFSRWGADKTGYWKWGGKNLNSLNMWMELSKNSQTTGVEDVNSADRVLAGSSEFNQLTA